MSERDEARRATILAYAHRFGAMTRHHAKYAGDFPFREVAERTDITPYPDIQDHQNCWDRLYANFDNAWSRFHVEP